MVSVAPLKGVLPASNIIIHRETVGTISVPNSTRNVLPYSWRSGLVTVSLLFCFVVALAILLFHTLKWAISDFLYKQDG